MPGRREAGYGLDSSKKKNGCGGQAVQAKANKDKGQAGNLQEQHRPPTSRFYRTAGRERTAESPSGGGGSGGKRGSGGRVASEDGHRDGHSREADRR